MFYFRYVQFTVGVFSFLYSYSIVILLQFGTVKMQFFHHLSDWLGRSSLKWPVHCQARRHTLLCMSVSYSFNKQLEW